MLMAGLTIAGGKRDLVSAVVRDQVCGSIHGMLAAVGGPQSTSRTARGAAWYDVAHVEPNLLIGNLANFPGNVRRTSIAVAGYANTL